MRKVFSKSSIYLVICLAILTGAVFICYGRTLGSYFLADDFGEVAYVSKIFEGDLARLWSNFTGNYMQVPSMAVYRPWLLMTLFFDFAVWKTNAFGFYLTNLLHYLACTFLIFALVRLLTGYWGKLRSNLAATFSGLLFAVNPLHCESVSWVVGRVDIVCLTYYLLGLVSVALYVRSMNKKWLILTFASFWLGILSKEMAIALPVTATLLALLWAKSETFLLRANNGIEGETGVSAGGFDNSGSGTGPFSQSSGASPQPIEPSRATAIAALQKLDQELQPPLHSIAASNESTASPIAPPPGPAIVLERIKVALPVGVMLFACTVVYFVIRYACLGTITGGYTGSIGSSQLSGILQKWTDVDTIMRIVFPLNQFVFQNDTVHKTLLTVLYLALVSLASARLLVGATPRRWLVFLFVASLTSLAPIYQLWGMGYNLEGSRFVFFLTVPLAMLFPIILFAPLDRKHDASGKSIQANNSLNGVGTKILVLSAVTLAALTLVYAKVTLRNNVPWVHAGKQTNALAMKAKELSASTPEGKLVCVVGIPKDEGGAHMILNGTTFRHLITPPFAPQGLTGKILTFEPVLFGNPEKIDTAHFKQALQRPNVIAFKVWDMNQKDFVVFDPGAPQAVPRGFEIPLANGSPVIQQSQNASVLAGALASFPYTSERGNVDLTGAIRDANAGLGIRISGLKLRPAQFDYLSIQTIMAEGSTFRGKTCKVRLASTSGEKTAFEADLAIRSNEANNANENVSPDIASGKNPSDTAVPTKQISNVDRSNTVVRIPLSAYWRYFTAGEISSVEIDLPAIDKLSIRTIELLPANLVAPSVSAIDRTTSNDGAFAVDYRSKSKAASKDANGETPVRISVDGSSLPAVSSIEVQVLRKNFFFDNLTSDAALESGTQDTLRSPGNNATVTLTKKMVDSSGYVQLRARGLDSANRQVGEYSYPITIRVLRD